MIAWMYFHTDPNEGNIDRVVSMLKNEFGLVPSDDGKRPEREFLVWEDNEGIGRYRVHIYENQHSTKFGGNADSFGFTYWTRGITEKVVRTDPMKAALERTRQTISGKCVEVIRAEKSADYIIANYCQ